jgi:Family of unknown function (DUF6229)
MKDTLVVDELVARWRKGGGQDNPAGPLFASGAFAEADITIAEPCITNCGTNCTGSGIHFCC